MNTDAICPACKGNVDDESVDHADLTPMEFVDGEVLPPVCVVCGHTAQSYVEVGEKNEVPKINAVGVLARLLGVLVGVFVIRIKPEPYVKEYKISVKLPVCGSHRQSRTLRPIYINYNRYRMTIPVHREFIQQWKNA